MEINSIIYSLQFKILKVSNGYIIESTPTLMSLTSTTKVAKSLPELEDIINTAIQKLDEETELPF